MPVKRPFDSQRSGVAVWQAAFTLIELLVVVAIIALLISILLPSLNKARDQAKAAVCATRLRSFGQASALYEGEFKSFAPCDPWWLMYDSVPGGGFVRNPNISTQKMDPAHGYLALFALDIKPYIADPNPANKAWEAVPFGFRVQSGINPEDLWEGFFCPAQKLRNTTDRASGELDATNHWEGMPVAYKYAAGYMLNRILRSAVTNRRGPGTRWSREPSDQFEQIFGPQGYDNLFGSAVVWVDAGRGSRRYHIQGTISDEVTVPADTIYMADSLDYHLGDSTVLTDPATGQSYGGSSASAGRWAFPAGGSPPPGAVLGARHNGKANVLYVDSHVSRDNQVPRNRRGTMIVASTFADFTLDRDMGSRFHYMPTGRRFGPRP